MNLNFIRQLVRLVEDSDINSLEVSSWGQKVKIKQQSAAVAQGQSPDSIIVQQAPAPAAQAPAAAPAQAEIPQETAEGTEDTGRLVPVKSPMVGTFYTAPAPDADPYVALNQRISKGQVVCIVEAMKLMNEIESEVGGRVARVMVENAQPVEFGQTMFLIDPD